MKAVILIITSIGVFFITHVYSYNRGYADGWDKSHQPVVIIEGTGKTCKDIPGALYPCVEDPCKTEGK